MQEDSDSEDELPLAARAARPAAPKRPLKDDSGDDDDESSSGSDSDSSDDSSSDDDVPLAQRRASATPAKKKPAAKPVKRKAESNKKPAKKARRSSGGGGGSGSSKAAKGGKKWDTLEHAGVMFPPEYEPHGIKMLYEGKPVDLTPEQEEVATMFAVMKDTDYISKPTWVGVGGLKGGGWRLGGSWVGLRVGGDVRQQPGPCNQLLCTDVFGAIARRGLVQTGRSSSCFATANQPTKLPTHPPTHPPHPTHHPPPPPASSRTSGRASRRSWAPSTSSSPSTGATSRPSTTGTRRSARRRRTSPRRCGCVWLGGDTGWLSGLVWMAGGGFEL
jgi:hypothetical protein